MKSLKNCHDCGVKPGQPHRGSCDVERCSVCGGQYMICGCNGHDSLFARWTGLWPGSAECAALELYSKFTPNGWELCDSSDPAATHDLNTFYSEGLYKIFFIKPSA